MSGRIAGLDVLRGIAVGLVMLRHAFPEAFAGAGVVGVVMFFAISGYLITGLLHEELAERGRVDLGRFYLRRARRLLPALLALSAGFAIVTLTLDPLGDRDRLVPTVVTMLTFTGNLPLAETSDASFHVWTLATEEQFYLLWPAVLLLAWRWKRTPQVLVGVAAVCLLACVATLIRLDPHPDLAYALPTSWAICFVIGGAARLYGTRWTPPASAVAAALAVLAVLSVLPIRGHALTYLVGGPVIAASTAVVLLAWRHWREVAADARGAVIARGLVLLGTVSYGAYLWNYPLTLWLRPELGGYAGPLALLLTLVAAAVSWHLVERPALRGRRTAAVLR